MTTYYFMDLSGAQGTCYLEREHPEPMHHRTYHAITDAMMPICDLPEIGWTLEIGSLMAIKGQESVPDASDPWLMMNRGFDQPWSILMQHSRMLAQWRILVPPLSDTCCPLDTLKTYWNKHEWTPFTMPKRLIGPQPDPWMNGLW